MQYHVVTSLNKKYWDNGSEKNIKSWDKLFPRNVQIHIYSEDGPLEGLSSRVSWYNLYETCPDLVNFIDTHKDDPHYNGERGPSETQKYKWNAVKFAHKTFALFHAATYAENYLIWMDADVLCFRNFNQEFLNRVCPKNAIASYLGRPTTHSECGFVGYNLNHKYGIEFLQHFESYYKDNNLSELSQTHDSFVFDYARNNFHSKEFFDLNKGAKTNKHPFNQSALRQFLTHTKGHNKQRKQEKFLKRLAL